MSITARQWILRANAAFLIVAATGGMATDLAGVFLGKGPQARVVAAAPFSAIGFVEAHGLAFIFGVLLWMAPPARLWHLTAVAIHVLLGTSNLVFWDIFPFAGMLAGGYITTSLHWVFVAVQAAAAAFAMRAGVNPARRTGGLPPLRRLRPPHPPKSLATRA